MSKRKLALIILVTFLGGKAEDLYQRSKTLSDIRKHRTPEELMAQSTALGSLALICAFIIWKTGGPLSAREYFLERRILKKVEQTLEERDNS